MQKESPYLDDVNELIELAHQMGLIDAQIKKYVSNATECMTWSAVQTSHAKNGRTVAFKFGDLIGVLLLISMGLGVALLCWAAEMMVYYNYFLVDFSYFIQG